MTVSNTLQNYLSSQGVEYDVLTHTPTFSASQTAQASHVSGNRIAKGVVLKDDQGFLMAVLPAANHIQFQKLQQLVQRKLDLASEEEAGEIFKDCEPGAFPAVGSAYGLEVVLDDSLMSQPEIFFEGGDHTCLLHVNAESFDRLMSPSRHGIFSAAD